MNLQEYQTAAERTMTDIGNRNRMLNAALGLCGEAAEVAKAYEWDAKDELLEECGDLLWYVAQMCKSQHTSIAHLHPEDQGWDEEQALDQLWHQTGYIADATKKRVFHGKPIMPLLFANALEQVVVAIDALLGFHGKTVAEACDFNIAKLLKRFPDGFSHEAANARADKAAQP